MKGSAWTIFTVGAMALCQLTAKPCLAQALRWRADLKSGADVSTLSFDPIGRLLAGGGLSDVHEDFTGHIVLWNVTTGKMHAELFGHTEPVGEVCFSPNRDLLASRGGRQLIIWDLATLKKHLAIRCKAQVFSCLAWSGDGKTVATGDSDGMLTFWDVATGKSRVAVKAHDHREFIPWVKSVTYHPDGKSLATGGIDGKVKLWDATTGRELAERKAEAEEVFDVAFSPDGRTLAAALGKKGTSTAARGAVVLWEIATGRVRANLRAETQLVSRIAFHPQGQFLLLVECRGAIRVWDLSAGKERPQLSTGPEEVVSNLAFTPDGRILAGASGRNTVKLWNFFLGPKAAE